MRPALADDIGQAALRIAVLIDELLIA